MQEIKNWQAAFKAQGKDPKVLPDAKTFGKAAVANYILPIVVAHLNGDWKPDYTETEQDKWEICWRVEADSKRPSGFALSLFGVEYRGSRTYCSVLFAFRDQETAEYAAEHPSLKKLWEDLHFNR